MSFYVHPLVQDTKGHYIIIVHNVIKYQVVSSLPPPLYTIYNLII